MKSLRNPPIVVFHAFDIIFTKVVTSLHLYKGEIFPPSVHNSVKGSLRNVN